MAQLIDIQEVAVGPKNLTARVYVADTAPLMTDEDIEATARVYNLMPHIAEHVCMGDKGETFKEAMPSTELAHMLEHVAVELIAQTGLADISCGRTWAVSGYDRTYDVQLKCVDDVLVLGALSSAVWIMQWAFSGGGEPIPDIEGIVEGLKGLVSAAETLEDNALVDTDTENDSDAAEDTDVEIPAVEEEPSYDEVQLDDSDLD